MGTKDDLEETLERTKTEAERRLAVRAGKAAVKTAWRGLVAAIEGVTDGVLGHAEKELAEAEAARGRGEIDLDTSDDGASEDALARLREDQARRATQVQDAPRRRGPTLDDKLDARDAARERELRAQAKLEVMKRALAEGRLRAPEPEPARPTRADPREERAREELEALEEQSVHPDDRPPAKRTL